MKSEEIAALSILSGIILCFVVDWFVWKRRHKREMKKFRNELGLDDPEWRKKNWNKPVKH